MSSVSRVRVEVRGESEQSVIDKLLSYVEIVQQESGGQWEIEEGEPEVQTAKDGYWGRVTIRRQHAQGDPVPQG